MFSKLSGLAIAAGLLITAVSSAQDSASQGAPEFDETVYLRNLYGFAGGRDAAGASAFFIELPSGVHVVTAKHLLGDAMGINPPVLPTQFDKQLLGWHVFHNPDIYDQTADPQARITGIHNPDDSQRDDVIVLMTDVSADQIAGQILPIAGDPVSAGQSVYLLGCTYEEGAACTQNLYAGAIETVVAADDFSGELVEFRLANAPASLSGFSGAPVLNSDGEVIAVLSGIGFDDRVIAARIPSWLRGEAQ